MPRGLRTIEAAAQEVNPRRLRPSIRTSPHARAMPRRVPVRVPLAANRPALGLAVRRVRDRFRTREV